MSQATASNVQNILSNISGGITLATEINGILTPIVSGVVKNIKAKTQGDTITFDLELQAGMDNLATVHQNVKDMLAEINAERAKVNMPPITVVE